MFNLQWKTKSFAGNVWKCLRGLQEVCEFKRSFRKSFGLLVETIKETVKAGIGKKLNRDSACPGCLVGYSWFVTTYNENKWISETTPHYKILECFIQWNSNIILRN